MVNFMNMVNGSVMIYDGKTNPGPIGMVMKIPIHGIYHIINTMARMNTNHLYRKNPIRDKEAEARRV